MDNLTKNIPTITNPKKTIKFSSITQAIQNEISSASNRFDQPQIKKVEKKNNINYKIRKYRTRGIKITFKINRQQSKKKVSKVKQIKILNTKKIKKIKSRVKVATKKPKKKQKLQKIDPYLAKIQLWAIRNKSNYIKYLRNKTCQICTQKKQNQSTKLILCTICDDAYHRDCLTKKITLKQLEHLEIWYCPPCQKIQTINIEQQQQGQIYQSINASIYKSDYGQYIKRIAQIIFKEKKYLLLSQLGRQFYTRQQKSWLGFKPFIAIQDKQLYWKPLLSALSATKYMFCPYQIYSNQDTLNLNKSIYNIPEVVERLSKKDQQAFEEFTQLVQKGQAPPLRVQKCPIKGFMIRSLQDIQLKTILCQYSGQVMTFRKALEQPPNDSIFTLLETGDSNRTLNVVPQKFANIGKYFLGINNKDLQNYLRINVQSILFSYKGRNRIMFYALRPIKKGELLYIDYNGGLGKDYPTATFK